MSENASEFDSHEFDQIGEISKLTALLVKMIGKEGVIQILKELVKSIRYDRRFHSFEYASSFGFHL